MPNPPAPTPPKPTTAVKAPVAAKPAAPPVTGRLTSLDAYRGFVMLLLIFLDRPNGGWAEQIANAHRDVPWVQTVTSQFEHVAWAGLVLWDMIQPSFMFLVGTAAAFSCASRARRGDSFGWMLAHAVYRSALLILLGVFLRSKTTDATNWTFEDVVSQIGLGYVFVFLLWNRGWKIQLGAVALLLIGYWALFAFWPLPEAGYDHSTVFGKAYYEGFQAHWNKNTNPAMYFDQWFLNLFPRAKPYVGHPGGYATLNFVPALVTMIMGLMAGELLRGERPAKRKFLVLVAAGVLCLGLGAGLHYGGVCPIVKRIWTPSFALFSGGICLLTLALFYAVIDMAGLKRWAFPAVVVGQNSIAAYVLLHLTGEWVVRTLERHLGVRPFAVLGAEYQPLLENLSVGVFVWLICYWLYRKKVHVRL